MQLYRSLAPWKILYGFRLQSWSRTGTARARLRPRTLEVQRAARRSRAPAVPGVRSDASCPAADELTTSGTPPIAVAITDVPHANASNMTSVCPPLRNQEPVELLPNRTNAAAPVQPWARNARGRCRGFRQALLVLDSVLETVTIAAASQRRPANRVCLRRGLSPL
jgi:hypothetical protein